ncbi:MAG: SDR family NAD(P)-dependent oxidoreductase [Candidatus Dojkabacteria bacterium]
MIIVTGASGHIGNVLVRHLLKKGLEVGVTDRDPENDPVLKPLNLKMYKGDVRDIDFLRKTFKDADAVIHTAGIVSITPWKKELMHEVNVEGTKNVVQACIDSKVKRLVYTSSVHALYEPPKGKFLIEKLAKSVTDVLGEYAKTKVLATREVLKGIEKGLDAVITYPSGVIGPYDFKHSEMGEMIHDYSSGQYKYYVDGAYNFVDVRDVANGIYLALTKGKKGEEYILAGNKITVKELFKLISEITNIEEPKFKIAMPFAKFLAPFALVYYKVTKKVPVFTPYSLAVLESNADISSEKAVKELGYSYRSIKESVNDTIEWNKGSKVDI